MSAHSKLFKDTCFANAEITILGGPFDVEGELRGYVNISARIEVNKPMYQWYHHSGRPMKYGCRSNITIGPIDEEDYGFYQLVITDGVTKQTKLTRWAELKKPTREQPPIPSPLHSVSQVQDNIHQPNHYVNSGKPINYNPQPLQAPMSLCPQNCFYQQQLTPVLLIQPEGGAYSRGSRITLTAHFENATHYQWYKDGVKLEGCVGNTLVINNANLGNTGNYDIYAFNCFDNYSTHVSTRVIVY